MRTTERWLPIPGHPGYLASDQGRIASTKRWRGKSSFRHLKQQPHSINGYPYVQLYGDGGKVCRSVHGLVAAAFLGPRPAGLEVCHNDGTRTNARLDNLRYDTPAANAADKVRHGTNPGQQTECIYGHEFTPENTRTYGNHRFCIECDRRRGREYRARKKAQAAVVEVRAANVPTERAA